MKTLLSLILAAFVALGSTNSLAAAHKTRKPPLERSQTPPPPPAPEEESMTPPPPAPESEEAPPPPTVEDEDIVPPPPAPEEVEEEIPLPPAAEESDIKKYQPLEDYFKSRPLPEQWIRAMGQGDLERMKQLVARDHAIINAVDINGQTALVRAFFPTDMESDPKKRKKREEIVMWLLHNGASTHYKSKTNRNLLMHAVAERVSPFSEAVLDALIQHGISVNAKTTDGGTALYFAVIAGNDAAVQFLLKKGAQIGKNDLAAAVQSALQFPEYAESYRAIIRALLQAGAHATTKNERGVTARGIVESSPESATKSRILKMFNAQ